MTVEEKRLLYEGFSAIISEENKLSHNRFIWLLTMQGFLFATLTQTENLLFQFTVSILGILVSAIMWNALWLNERAMEYILKCWDEKLEKEYLSSKDFPPIWAGAITKYKYNPKRMPDRFMKVYGKYLTYRHSIPICFALAWFVLFSYCVMGFLHLLALL